MTDSQAPIEDRENNIRTLVADRVTAAHEALFERLDKLKKRNITDTDIIRALRHNDDATIATEYIEWADAIDPDVDPTPADGGVTDPHDAPSYDAMPAPTLQEGLNTPTMRFCIDADCPGCGFPERVLIREVLPDGSPGGGVYTCNKCDYKSQERNS